MCPNIQEENSEIILLFSTFEIEKYLGKSQNNENNNNNKEIYQKCHILL